MELTRSFVREELERLDSNVAIYRALADRYRSFAMRAEFDAGNSDPSLNYWIDHMRDQLLELVMQLNGYAGEIMELEELYHMEVRDLGELSLLEESGGM